jgi:hypothetical protein
MDLDAMVAGADCERMCTIDCETRRPHPRVSKLQYFKVPGQSKEIILTSRGLRSGNRENISFYVGL